MVDLSEKQYNSIFNLPKEKGDTIVIDNGTYELKAGFSNEISIISRNNIYKFKNRYSLDPFPSASIKTMFDNDIIINFDVTEHTIDTVINHLSPSKLKNLIFTVTPFSPTENDLIKFLFEVYSFEKIQLGYDFLYSYHRYMGNENCLIVSLKYSGVFVTVVEDKQIKDIYKISFGAKELYDYINCVMIERYRNFRVNYRNLADYIRISSDYESESIAIYTQMCESDYSNNIFLTDESIVNIFEEKNSKKYKKVTTNVSNIPELNYNLLTTNDNSLTNEQLKEKRRQRLIYSGNLFRLKTSIEKYLSKFWDLINETFDELEKKNNFEQYLANKKQRFFKYKRELELRSKLRRDSKNRKTREFFIRNKEGILDENELFIKNQILDAEDEIQEREIFEKMDKLASEIKVMDPEFIPYFANTVEILRGDNLGRECVNIDLIKWGEIFFDPSIIGSEEMGLTEIFENVCSKYKISNVLVCGGLNYFENLSTRIEKEIKSMSYDQNIKVLKTSDSQKDPFLGACFSELLPVYTRSDYKNYNIENQQKNKKYE